jgi:hypothetical protein
MKKIIVLALSCALLTVSGMEISSLRQIWHENLDICIDNSRRLSEIYSQPDGFIQWKADGEWLINEEVVEEIFANQNLSESRNLFLLSTWIIKGIMTHAFGDEIWEENIRDSAIPFMESIINVYRTRVESLQNGEFKDYMNSLVHNLVLIKKYFGEVTRGYGEWAQTIQKCQQIESN